jgi:single-stranded-DNA-specific exonuclease
MITSWTINKHDPESCKVLVDALNIHPVIAQILINRGIGGAEEAKRYLMPDLAALPDPFLLPDMSRAVDRIVKGLGEGEKIAVIGDYDVDGVASTALLVHFFRAIGVEVEVHIPHRVTEGYGLNDEAIDRLKERGANLIITVDNGTRSIAELERARSLGIDVVVTDHHEVGDALPQAVAVINPKRSDSKYPDSTLAGCGVAFMLVMALRRRLRDEGKLIGNGPNLKEHLDLVATGTVADIVPLTGVNRVLTKFGLNEALRTNKPGLRALMEICGLPDKTGFVRAGHVAFRIGPRLNAAGRMDNAYPSLECLTTEDPKRARELAALLDTTNANRQQLEESILRDALSKKVVNDERRKSIVVSSTGWHPGVIGIVASRLARMMNKPSVVIACENGVGKGSVRTAGDIDLMKVLSDSSDLLDRFGGHQQAAGLTIDVQRIDEFSRRFDMACCAQGLGETAMHIDAEVEPEEITDQLVHELSHIEPFGQGNPEPVFCSPKLTIAEMSVVGGKHVRLTLTDGTRRFSGIAFDMVDEREHMAGQPLLAYTPQFNTWNGRTTIQLKVRALLNREIRDKR